MAGERVPPETGPASQPFHLVALLSDLRSSLSDVLHSTRSSGLPPSQRDNYSPPDLDDLEDQIPPPLLRETCAQAADVYLHRQWRLSAAQSFAHAVTATLKRKRQADASWRNRALNNAARAFWTEAASQKSWPHRLAKVRFACEVPVLERPTTPDSSPPLRAGTKRLRSPNIRSGREKRRRSNTNDIIVPAVNTRTVTGDASSLVFGLSVADLPATDTAVWDSRDCQTTNTHLSPTEVDHYAQRYIYDLLRPCLGNSATAATVSADLSEAPPGEPAAPTGGEGASKESGQQLLSHTGAVPFRTRNSSERIGGGGCEREPQFVHTRIRVPCTRHRASTINNEGLGPVIAPPKAVDTDRAVVWANKSNLILSQYPCLLESIADPGAVWPEKSWCPPPSSCYPAGESRAELIEIVTSRSCTDYRRSAWASRKVVCKSSLRVRAVRLPKSGGDEQRRRSLEVVSARLHEAQTMESTIAIVSPHPIIDVGLMAAIALTGWTWPPELASAWTILCRYRHLQMVTTLRLSPTLKQRILSFTKNADDLGVIDDTVNISSLVVQDYAAHVVAKISEPLSEWANKVIGDLVRFTQSSSGTTWIELTTADGDEKKKATIVLPLEALYFVVRRNNREKRRGKAAVEARKSGFDLERALQQTETPSVSTIPPVPAASSRYAGLVSRLPLWASPFRKAVLAPNPRDLWEITLPLLSAFNQFGGALINVADRRSDRSDFTNRFLTPEQVADLHRPILFVRMTRFLPVINNNEPTAAATATTALQQGAAAETTSGTSLSARCNKVAIGPTSPAAASGSNEAQALCADQMALPTTVCIKAANRSGKMLEMSWDPYEEYYLWRAVADQVRYRFRPPNTEGNRPIDDEFLDRMHEEMVAYLSLWGGTPTTTKNPTSSATALGGLGGSGVRGGRCWWPRIVHHFMEINWDFVAHVVNTTVLPFARCRSSEACKAKFISLLFEYVAGGLSLAPPEPSRDHSENRHNRGGGSVNNGAPNPSPPPQSSQLEHVDITKRQSTNVCVAHLSHHGSWRLHNTVLVPYVDEDETFNVWKDDLWEVGLGAAAATPSAVDDIAATDSRAINYSWVKQRAGGFARVPNLNEMPLNIYSKGEMATEIDDEEAAEDELRRKLDADWVDEDETSGALKGSPPTILNPLTSSPPPTGLPPLNKVSSELDSPSPSPSMLLEESQLQRLMTYLSAIADSAKSFPPSNGRSVGWFNTLEAQVARLQFGKIFTHFKTQGLLSLAAVSALEPSSSNTSTVTADLTAAEADSLIKLLNLAILGDQGGRLMTVITTLHTEAERRKRGQCISHENFVMEKSLRNLIGAPECLALVQAMRDYMQTKGAVDSNQAPPSAVHSQIQQKYHRLLLPICDSQSRWAHESMMAAETLSQLPCYMTNQRDLPTFLPPPIAPLLRMMTLSTSGRFGFDMLIREPVLYALGHTKVPYLGRLLDLKRPVLPTFTIQPFQARPPATPASRRGAHSSSNTSFDPLYLGRVSPAEQTGAAQHNITPTLGGEGGGGASDVSARGRPGGYGGGVPTSSQSKRMSSNTSHQYSPQQRSNRPASRPVSILTPPMVPLGGGYYAPQAPPPGTSDRPSVLPNPWGVKSETAAAAAAYARDFTGRPPDPPVPPQYGLPPGANMYMHMSGHYQAPPQPAWPPPSPSAPSQGRGHAPRYMTQPTPHQWGGTPAAGYLGVKGGAYMPQQYTSGGPPGAPTSYTGYPSAPSTTSQMSDYFGRSGASPSGTAGQGQRLPPPMYVDPASQYARGPPQHRPPPQYYRPPDYSGQVPPPYYDARNAQWRPPM